MHYFLSHSKLSQITRRPNLFNTYVPEFENYYNLLTNRVMNTQTNFQNLDFLRPKRYLKIYHESRF